MFFVEFFQIQLKQLLVKTTVYLCQKNSFLGPAATMKNNGLYLLFTLFYIQFT